MTKSNFICLSGWSFIVGAVAFLPGAILNLDYGSRIISPLVTYTFFWAPVLLVVGLLGLQARYKFGNGVLSFGAIVGGFLVFVGALIQFLPDDYSVSVTYFGVWVGGVFVLHLSLFIFGILVLIEKPLPHWNWLPLFAGMWVPLLPLLAVILQGTIEGSPYSNMEKYAIIAIFVSMTVAQVMLGYMLQADVTHDTKTSQQGQPA
jgi:hypothetical protein